MRDITEPYGLCHLDPITLAATAIGGLAGGLFSSGSSGGGGSAPAPVAPPSTPTVAAPETPAAAQSKPAPKPQQPSFLGAAATPAPTQSSQKTLLGQ